MLAIAGAWAQEASISYSEKAFKKQDENCAPSSFPIASSNRFDQ
jgi:hypothetical protein